MDNKEYYSALRAVLDAQLENHPMIEVLTIGPMKIPSPAAPAAQVWVSEADLIDNPQLPSVWFKGRQEVAGLGLPTAESLIKASMLSEAPETVARLMIANAEHEIRVRYERAQALAASSS